MSSDRPLTPPTDTATIPQSLAIQGTPHSQGSGSHYSYQSQNHQSDYQPYLKEDLKHQYTVTFDEFLNDILHLTPQWIGKNATRISDIVHTQCFGKIVSNYREPVTHETSRYPPFIVLANYVLDQLDHNPDSNICFCRNDPVLVGGSRAERKPDVAGVRYQSLEVLERSSVDNLMKDGPEGACFWWTELLLFFEFKLVYKQLLEDPVQDAVTRDRSSTVVPSTSNSPLGASPSQSASRKQSMSLKEPAPRTMTTQSASRPSPPSASGSKRSSNATSSNASHRSKRQKVDGAASADLSMLQCASYALEMLSHGGLRSHVISALVTDATISLLYYDRSIIIVSRPVNFLEDPSRFVALLHTIGNLTLPQLGYADVIKPAPLLENPRKTTDIFDGLELTLSDGSRLVLGSTIYHQHGIIGRGTCVVRARRVEKTDDSGTDDDAWDGPLIVKLSWPAKSRISENDIIEQARDAANHDEHRWVLKHLPKVLHAEDRNINLLSRALIDRMGGQYEERVLRILVQEELSPITERTAAIDLAQSFREIFKCYRWLFEVPKILHRDISLNNLMIRKEGSNVYGVLNDLDLAVDVDVQSASSKQRTGTKPFMAIDLLRPDPPVHVYRHDLESMFYVLIWITSRFHGGAEIADPPLQEWADQCGATLVDRKCSFILSEPPPPTPEFYPLGHWVVSLMKMMRNGISARTEYRSELAIAVRSKTTYPPTFDDETLGGFVTFDMFQAILDTKLL